MNSKTTAIGVIIVDHGSRRTESNDLLLQVVQRFADVAPFDIVEPAHMELAKPDIAAAFAACVARGATQVVVFPYFLSPGRHWKQDIPALVEEAAVDHPEVSWTVTQPFGQHDGMLQIIQERIAEAIR